MEAANRRIIFLDIDGVLNALGHDGETRPFVSFDDVAVGRLGTLLQASAASLVLTTAWRKHLAYLNSVFGSYGILGQVSPKSGPERALSSMMRTPVFADSNRRDLEILRWLQMHEAELGVEAWVVLDDADLLRFPDTSARLEGHVVRTQPERGLSDENVELALKFLDTQAPRSVCLKKADVPPQHSLCNGLFQGAAEPAKEAASDNAVSAELPLQRFLGSGLFQGVAEPMNEALLSDMRAVLSALRPHEALQSLPEPVCDEGHILQNCRPPSSGFCCEECGEDLDEGHLAFRCDACGGITFCTACVTNGLANRSRQECSLELNG